MQPGDICGKYEIVRELGSGGFGTVYLAIKTDLPNRQVVLKHFDPKDPLSPAQLQKIEQLFRQEAKILKDLGDTCKCIPELHDFFEEKGNIYLVQEFILGSDLTDRLKSGRILSKEDTVEMIRSILTPLQCVHRANIIHRDLKLANIRIREEDEKLFLIDFGISKKIKTQFSNSVFSIGTPGYMSPEQIQSAKLTVASDIYAVGTLGLFAITGLDPQKDKLPQDPQTGKIIASKVNADPQLIKFLNGALVHDLNKRYKNAEIALQALNSLDNLTQPSNSTTNTIPGSPNPNPPPMKPTSNRSRLLILLGLIALVVGILGYILSPKEEWREYSIAEHGMRLNRPIQWDVVTNETFGNPDDIATIYPSGQSELKCADSIIINITKSQDLPISIDEHKRNTTNLIKKNRQVIGSIVDRSTTDTRISSIPAFRLNYKFTDFHCGIREVIDTSTIDRSKGKLYSMIYHGSPSTFNNNLATVDRIINSIKID